MEIEHVLIKVVLRILDHAGIPTCLVGEIALNYYNVPRVIINIEICVPEDLVSKATSSLLSTGLYIQEDLKKFDVYTEHMRGFPRLQGQWMTPNFPVIIYPDTFFNLNPLVKNIIPRNYTPPDSHYSTQITNWCLESNIPFLSLPRLPAIFIGLCQRYLNFGDRVAAVNAEQLVDGMNIDEEWCNRNLSHTAPELLEYAIKKLVPEKLFRIFYFQDNKITCFVATDEEAQKLKRIPGYE